MEKKQYKTSCKSGGVYFDIAQQNGFGMTSFLQAQHCFLLFFFCVLPWQKNLLANKMKGDDALYKEKPLLLPTQPLATAQSYPARITNNHR